MSPQLRNYFDKDFAVINWIEELHYRVYGWPIVFLCLFFLIAFSWLLIWDFRWNKLKPRLVTYLSGHPSLLADTEGRLEIKGKNIVFESYNMKDVLMEISLQNITDVNAQHDDACIEVYGPFDFLYISYLDDQNRKIRLKFLTMHGFAYVLSEVISKAMPRTSSSVE